MGFKEFIERNPRFAEAFALRDSEIKEYQIDTLTSSITGTGFNRPFQAAAENYAVGANANGDEGDKTLGGGSSTLTPGADEKRDGSQSSESDLSLQDDAQEGVKRMQAVTQLWTKRDLILAYVFIFLISCVTGLQQQMFYGLTPYVASGFEAHSLTAAVGIVANIVAGCSRLVLAKVLDIWGRPQGLAIMTFIATIGLIMMAAADSIQMYMAAQVFWQVGTFGRDYTLSVFMCDTTSLKNRSLAFAFDSAPFFFTTFAGGPLAERFLALDAIPWGFGTFAIAEPIACLPLFLLFWHYQRKASKLGLLRKIESNRTWTESAKYYFIQFDVVGLFLCAGGFSLFLLPFSLYSFQADEWASPMIISMLVLGVGMLVGFGLYEKYLAPVQFIPFHMLTDRTIFGGNMVISGMFMSFYIWNGFFRSFLQVVFDQSVTQANYIGNIYTLGSCFMAIIVAIAIRITGRFKWFAVYFGVPMTFLGVGCMYHFRQPGWDVGLVAMCQIFFSLGGGAIVITTQLAVLASVRQQGNAVVLAVQWMFTSIFGAIGSTLATAVWTGNFPAELRNRLPPEADFDSIYASIEEQLAFPLGHPIRDAIADAYGTSQRYMIIASIGILVITVPSVLIWRNINVKKFQQTKGQVW